MALALKTPKAHAEAVRSIILEMDLFDPDRSIGRNGDILFPLRSLSGAELSDLSTRLEKTGVVFELIDAPSSTRGRSRSRPPMVEITDSLKGSLGPALIEQIPRKYERVGDVLVLVIPPSLEGFKDEVARTFCEVLGTRYVLRDIGGVGGELRNPRTEVLVPPEDGEFTTVHRENGVLYVLDPRDQMLSSGNVSERARARKYLELGPPSPRAIASKDGDGPFDGEVVYDMFAGIGYFSLPVAFSPSLKRVVSAEKNPKAFRNLAAGISLNCVAQRVVPILGDSRMTLPEDGADRIMMGYVGGTVRYLERALDLISPSGAVIHLHDTVRMEVGAKGLYDEASDIALARGVCLELFSSRRVKSFAPCIDHVVLDLVARPESVL